MLACGTIAPVRSSAVRQLGAATLGLEALAIYFCGLVLYGLNLGSADYVLIVVGTTIVSLVIAAARMPRSWAIALGSLLQVPIVAAGLIIPAMFVVGGAFCGLWVGALALGQRIDRQRAQRAATIKGGFPKQTTGSSNVAKCTG